MTDKTQAALKLALEALMYTPTLSPAVEELCDDAIDAINEALAEQPAQHPTNCRHCGGAADVICAGQCKEKPAQP